MRLTVADRIRVDRGLLARLITAGLTDVAHGDVEIHLKARADVVQRWVVVCREAAGCGRRANYATAANRGHCAKTRRRALELAGDPGAHRPPQQMTVRASYAFSGRAYPQLPLAARVGPGVRWLVTLKMPADPTATGDPYPRVSRYQRYRTAPPAAIADWTEELVHLAAHEARHIHQFRHRLPRSEIDAERWAHRRLAAYRREHGLPVLNVEIAGQFAVADATTRSSPPGDRVAPHDDSAEYHGRA